MNLRLVDEITKSQLRDDVPEFRSGTTVKVHVRIREGDKTRIQIFEGVVIKKQGKGIGETFTVRKISNNKRTFPIHSPIMKKKLKNYRSRQLNYCRSGRGKN